MLMVDCAGWGQYPDSIKYNGKEVFNADSQRNTVFSIHMYEYAGGDSTTVKTNIDNALSIGVPVVIGEFGAQHTNGDVDEQTILNYCAQKGVGYLGWSWKGNGSGLEYLDISNTWDGSSLTDWGNTLFYGTNGIKSTASVCSVYGTSSGSSSGNVYTDSNGAVIGLDGTYYIKSVHSGKYLDVAEGRSAMVQIFSSISLMAAMHRNSSLLVMVMDIILSSQLARITTAVLTYMPKALPTALI